MFTKSNRRFIVTNMPGCVVDLCANLIALNDTQDIEGRQREAHEKVPSLRGRSSPPERFPCTGGGRSHV